MSGYSLEYILDNLTLDLTMMIYDYGIGFEKTKSIILINTYAEAISGKKKMTGDTPDIKKFKRIYGNQIKTKVKE
jgi:hypothetical protein